MNKETVALNDGLVQMGLIDMYTECCKPKQQNVHSVQVHLEHVPGQITCQATKIGSKNLRRLKSYQASIPTVTLKQEINYKKNWKKQTRPFEGKHHATKQPMSPQREKNFKK